ncbi:hypothetical protein AN214_01169 [Pseudoalteromonas sp. P1-9]|nr:hypothetical protein AN214_01169 [Pseudoalteromonas sp. P1-9]
MAKSQGKGSVHKDIILYFILVLAIAAIPILYFQFIQ